MKESSDILELGIKELRTIAPALKKRVSGAGAFTQSIFVPDTQQAISAMGAGNLVVWDRTLVGINDGQGRPTDRSSKDADHEQGGHSIH